MALPFFDKVRDNVFTVQRPKAKRGQELNYQLPQRSLPDMQNILDDYLSNPHTHTHTHKQTTTSKPISWDNFFFKSKEKGTKQILL